ncbi:MAG: KamA family radical SAM protein [Candidatus Micrarchaeia archaeon]
MDREKFETPSRLDEPFVLINTHSDAVDLLYINAPGLMGVLKESNTFADARKSAKEHLLHTKIQTKSALFIKRATACRRRLIRIFSERNEKICEFSTLYALYLIAKDKSNAQKYPISLLNELVHLMHGLSCASILTPPEKIYSSEQEEVSVRTNVLDEYSLQMQNYLKKYSCGLDKKLIIKREKNKAKILSHFGAQEKDWDDWTWHLRNIIKDKDTLQSLVTLCESETQALVLAEELKIPFNITPHYLSLFNFDGKSEEDRVPRSQVLPTSYGLQVISKTGNISSDLDFMGERHTSPIELITRRYPQILIVKPFDACPQICQYCQRNWQLKTYSEAELPMKEKMRAAIDWISSHPSISEVLITGGDPLTLNNQIIDDILSQISQIDHIRRMRIGTRTLVTIPQRIDAEFIEIAKKYHEWGKRELCIMTHFEHASEITPEVLNATKKIKNAGMNIYNQQVFTYFNSRRFETSHLRKWTKLIGIDPYYTFNTKGKEETKHFRVPIARLKQERWEEARLLPGVERTDEPVFNIPKIGKSHLRATGSGHELVGFNKDGNRMYRFFPWEYVNAGVQPYIYTDVSVYDYLKRLENENEILQDYATIWNY